MAITRAQQAKQMLQKGERHTNNRTKKDYNNNNKYEDRRGI